MLSSNRKGQELFDRETRRPSTRSKPLERFNNHCPTNQAHRCSCLFRALPYESFGGYRLPLSRGTIDEDDVDVHITFAFNDYYYLHYRYRQRPHGYRHLLLRPSRSLLRPSRSNRHSTKANPEANPINQLYLSSPPSTRSSHHPLARPLRPWSYSPHYSS
jgi:hypothetical protein